MPAIDDATLNQLREQLAQAEADGERFCTEIERLRAAVKDQGKQADHRSIQNVELRRENERLRAALRKVTTTLTAVENSPSFQGIWPFLHAHGYKYHGPDWRDALADARLVLNVEQGDKP